MTVNDFRNAAKLVALVLPQLSEHSAIIRSNLENSSYRDYFCFPKGCKYLQLLLYLYTVLFRNYWNLLS